MAAKRVFKVGDRQVQLIQPRESEASFKAKLRWAAYKAHVGLSVVRR